MLQTYQEPELANSIENTIAIAFLSTIAIAIAIDKAIFQLLLSQVGSHAKSSPFFNFHRNLQIFKGGVIFSQ